MNPIITMTAAELGRKIASQELSSVEVTKAFLARIDEVNDKINAFLFVDHEGALAQAQAVDEKIAAGEKLGPLAGVPLAVKDLFCQKGIPTTASSKILEGWLPPYNATIVERCLAAGLVLLGKTNLDEFAMGSSTETSAFDPTHNPWDLEKIPGGSGGGSAAALAAFMAPLALGTDTGGSIRQPAAVTGSVGVKPTYGQASRYGVIAMASSLDQPGPCARNVEDTALLHAVICGYDPMDSTSINAEMPDVVNALSGDVRGMKIGVVKEFGGEGYQEGVLAQFQKAVTALAKAGAEIVEVSCPNFDYALPAYYLIMPSEVSSNLAKYDAMRFGLRVGDNGQHSAEEVMKFSRGAGFGLEAKRRIIIGTYALSAGYYDAYYGSAQKVRRLISQDFDRAFQQVDVLISPTTPYTAWKLGEKVTNPIAMYKADLCTIPSNMAGNASGSFPIGCAAEDGMPVGFQVMAPALADDRVYRVGAAIEKEFGVLLEKLADKEF